MSNIYLEPSIASHSSLLNDERTVSIKALESTRGARWTSLLDLVPILASPDSGLSLAYYQTQCYLGDSKGNRYPIRDELPILLPVRLQQFFSDHLKIEYEEVSDSFLQYYFLSTIKQSGAIGEINAAFDDVHYQRHLYRMKNLLSNAKGLVVDIGCDDPTIGAKLLPESTTYIGLDPFCNRPEPFRVVGFGENLPFGNETIDCAVFNTSLDHIFDWRRAISEAWRVLVPGGNLFISTLVWTENADLITDAVHFHHFRDYEIHGSLMNWVIEKELRYSYKNNSHRHGLYLSAQKPFTSSKGS